MTTCMELLQEGVTAAHTIQYMKKQFLQHGYKELDMGQPWELEENGRYYVNLYGTNGMAFTVGAGITSKPVFRIAMAHSDYPLFQIKPEPVRKGKDAVRLNVEIYGGMYQKSWLDRPLGIAGTVFVRGKDAFTPEKILYRSDRPLAIIPSLAIHMDRELNKKGALDTAKELVPLIALHEQADLLDTIAAGIGRESRDILDYELYLYNMDRPVTVGLDEAMLSSPRIDNLSSVAAILEAMLQTGRIPENHINCMIVFDNEEVGSRSGQGADSELFPMLLHKIGRSLVSDSFHIEDTLADGFLLSVDVAHAHHPNYEEKSDVTNKAYLGNGFALKRSVGQKYGTTAQSAAVVKRLCEEHQIPYSIAVNRTGIPGGSTLGPIVTEHLPMPCADIGMPILAMHSATELGAIADYNALREMLHTFYEA